MSESIDFQKPTKLACTQEIKAHCSGGGSVFVPVTRCLRQYLGTTSLSPACTKVCSSWQLCLLPFTAAQVGRVPT
jgi:hypothetical protein